VPPCSAENGVITGYIILLLIFLIVNFWLLTDRPPSCVSFNFESLKICNFLILSKCSSVNFHRLKLPHHTFYSHQLTPPYTELVTTFLTLPSQSTLPSTSSRRWKRTTLE
jgi:hypothetical protein